MLAFDIAPGYVARLRTVKHGIRLEVSRRWLWLLIAAVIGIAALSMIGDVRSLGDRLAGFHWWALIAGLALAFGNYVMRLGRWEIYLRRQQVRVPFASSAIVFFAGLSLSITPAKLGELVKSYLLREMHDVPAPKTAPIVVAERVTDLIALLVLAIIGVAAYGVDPTLVAVAGGVVALGLVLLAWPVPTHALIDLVTRPQRIRKLREPLHETLRGLGALCRPVPLAIATLIAVPAWGLECIGFALICNAFPGAHVDLGLAMVIYAGTTIAGALSFLPGGLGVTEGAMTVALVEGAAKLDPSTAVAATLLTRIATLWFAVAIGVVFLAIARRRIARRSG
jgi:glycosyltransferase 2 family protein